MTDGTTTPGHKGHSETEGDGKKIKVIAHLECPNCGYKKSFKNQFDRDKLDMLVVSAKVMAWSACDCGELIEFSLEFEI